MANHKTGAQRYNDRMDKIWETARKNGALNDKKQKVAKKMTRKQEYWADIKRRGESDKKYGAGD